MSGELVEPPVHDDSASHWDHAYQDTVSGMSDCVSHRIGSAAVATLLSVDDTDADGHQGLWSSSSHSTCAQELIIPTESNSLAYFTCL